MAYVINEPQFLKNLDTWLDKNDQKAAAYIASKKGGIPPIFTTYTKKLYRGMIVDDDFMLNFNKEFVFPNFTSWSKSEKIARLFATPNSKLNISKIKGGHSLLITKTIPASSIIFDISGFCQFMGVPQLEMMGVDALAIENAMEEEEVLVKKGLKITVKDVTVFKP